MNRILLILEINLLILSAQTCLATNDSTTIVTPERIGKCLSDLLVARGDIKESSLAINIHRLFPDEDFSQFEDSPAMFILTMLYGQQLLLPQAWDNLLFHADSLNIDKQAEYLKTYFVQIQKDQFLSTVVLMKFSKYYTFTFSILEWKNDRFVMRIYENFKEYNNMEELEENLFDIEELWIESDMSDSYSEKETLEVKEYKHNQSYKLPEIEEICVISANSFTEDLTLAIEQLKEYGSENIFLSVDEYNEFSDYDESMKKMWKELIFTLKEEKDFHIQNKSILLRNFPADFYSVVITYNIDFQSESYTLNCLATLINDKWKLIDILPLEKNKKFMFTF
jgi:hypothetical protein